MKIQPLNSSYKKEGEFIPFKKFLNIKYEKIIGCYVIKNTEEDLYYVGQSKDVIKSIRQHFKGTAPNNIIFAEGYFSSNLSNKDNLFEIKIIQLQTKEELDSSEKELIEFYNAKTIGYNSTVENT